MEKYSYLFRNGNEIIIITHDNNNAWIYNTGINKVKRISGVKIITTSSSITIISKYENITFSSNYGKELLYLGASNPVKSVNFEEKDIEEAIVNGEINIEKYVNTENIGKLSLLGNQIQLNEGKERIDLLYQSEKGLFVIVELKKGKVKKKDIDQTFRYSQIIDEIYSGESIAYLLAYDYDIPDKVYAENLGIKLHKF